MADPRVPWRLIDLNGRRVAEMPDDRTPGDSHAIAWALYARDAAGLSEAILVGDDGRRRVMHAELTTSPFRWPDQLGLYESTA